MTTTRYRCDDPICAVYGERTHLTIRESRPEERESIGPFCATGTNMQARAYLVVDMDDPERLLGAFGMAYGGATKGEAVFWAERSASKNDGHFIWPDGWERRPGRRRPCRRDVKGELPPEPDPE